MASWMLNQSQLLVLVAVGACTTAHAAMKATYVGPAHLPEPVSNSVLLRRLSRSLDPQRHHVHPGIVGSSYATVSLHDELDRVRTAVRLMGARPNTDPGLYKSLSENYGILYDILASRQHHWPRPVTQKPIYQYPEFHPVTSSYSQTDFDNVGLHFRDPGLGTQEWREVEHLRQGKAKLPFLPSTRPSGLSIKGYPWDPALDYLYSGTHQTESDDLIDLNAAFLDDLKESMSAGNVIDVDLPDVFTLDPKLTPKPRGKEPVIAKPKFGAPAANCPQAAADCTPPARAKPGLDKQNKFEDYLEDLGITDYEKNFNRAYSEMLDNDLKDTHFGYPEEDAVFHKMTAQPSKGSLQLKGHGDITDEKLTAGVSDHTREYETESEELNKMVMEYIENLKNDMPVLPVYPPTTTPLPQRTLKVTPQSKLRENKFANDVPITTYKPPLSSATGPKGDYAALARNVERNIKGAVLMKRAGFPDERLDHLKRNRRDLLETRKEAVLHAEACHAQDLLQCGGPALKQLLKAGDMKGRCMVREEFLTCMTEARHLPCPKPALDQGMERLKKSSRPSQDPKFLEVRKELRRQLSTNCFIGYSTPSTATEKGKP